MLSYVLGFEEIGQSQVAVVGGKGAHLAELSRIDGIRVPPGYCVTTDAFRRMMSHAPAIDALIGRLSRVQSGDRDAIRALSAEIRRSIEAAPIPPDLAAAIVQPLARLGERQAYAVRSSATAEDSPTASSAGQYDTYLNVVGPAAIVEHVRRCWASLFTERAVTYRLRHAVDPRTVLMAVVVQRMVDPDSAGILFTADPINGNRKLSSIEATFGLGEALVSGRVDSDVYRVRGGEITSRQERLERRPLTDAQIIELARLGRRIEAHFGQPQDIEWCLAGGELHFVQSRPITTLFPVPAAPDDAPRVYLSTGHQQMMTDAVKPLGLSVRQLTGQVPFHEVGGRWYVDATRMLASAAGRAGLINMAGKDDPLVGDALQTIIDRGFIPSQPDQPSAAPPPAPPQAQLPADPSIVRELIDPIEASLASLKRNIRGKSGPALIEFLLADFEEFKRVLFTPRSRQVFMAAMEATWWLNEKLEAWLGEKNVADTLTLSVDGNVTSEMGLALLDVADVIRPHPEVVAFLERVCRPERSEGSALRDTAFLDELPRLPGGREARDAIAAWLDQYGMRGVGEVDITRPRWTERPATLLPLILGNVRNFEPGEAKRRFQRGREAAARKEREVLDRLRALPDGEQKAEETKRMIDRVRTFIGYREYPKYGMMARYFVYKRALMDEADRLVQAGVIPDREDIFYLTFHELGDVVRSQRADAALIRRRKDEFRSYEALTPPRVLTSEGECVAGAYRRDDLPAGALVGFGVSAGTVEGRARVILDMADADLEPGDILVTTFTDPSWTPLFVAVSGLVTEVGGLMTHGAVIAREYGLPAVVGVENATKLIPDGQRIRVHGAEGYVEVIQAP